MALYRRILSPDFFNELINFSLAGHIDSQVACQRRDKVIDVELKQFFAFTVVWGCVGGGRFWNTCQILRQGQPVSAMKTVTYRQSLYRSLLLRL